VVCYQGISTWEAFSWNILTGHFIKRLTKNRPTDDRYPSFSFNSQFIVDALTETVHILYSDSGITARIYQFRMQRIRSVYVSASTMEIVVLMGKNVVVLEVCESKKISTKKFSQRVEDRDVSDIVLLTEEMISNDFVHPRIVLRKDEFGEITAVETSQRSDDGKLQLSSQTDDRSGSLVNTWVTPDGNRRVQLFTWPQVFDSQLEEIVYTPKCGDVIHRMDSSVDPAVTKTLIIPNLDVHGAGIVMMDLLKGDRILKEDGKVNKIKFRVLDTGLNRVVTVPSVISIGPNKLRDNQSVDSLERRITIYQEEVATLSNSYLVTIKLKLLKEFVNVYDLNRTKFITSHECHCIRDQRPESTGVANDVIVDNRSGSVVEVSTDETKLYIVNNRLHLRIFSGKNFADAIASIAIFPDGFVCSRIKNIYLPPLNDQICIIHYSTTKGRNDFSSTETKYIHVNIISRACSLPLNAPTPLDDISMDGQFGITDRLVVYNLLTAKIWKAIPYEKSGVNMQVLAKICENNQRVVFIDKQDDTVHVVELLSIKSSSQDGTDVSVRYVASCFTHAPHVLAVDSFTLRHHGRVFVLGGAGNLIVLALRESYESEGSAVVLSAHPNVVEREWSEAERALLLVK